MDSNMKKKQTCLKSLTNFIYSSYFKYTATWMRMAPTI